MRKIFVVLILILVLTPLFARGTVETVSDQGVQGLFNTLKELYGFGPEAELELGAEPEPEAESEPELDVPFFETTFSYKGVESYVTISDIEATFTLPEGTEDEQLNDFFALLIYKYPSFAEAEIKINGSLLIVDYPQVDREILLSVYSLVESVAKDYIDYLISELNEPVVEETVAEETVVEEPVVQEEHVVPESVSQAESAPQPVEEEPVAIEQQTEQQPEQQVEPEPEVQTESVTAEVAPVESVIEIAPVKAGSASSFTFNINAGIKGLISSEKESPSIFPTISATVRFNWNFLYGEAGGDLILFQGSGYLFTVGAVKANIGLSYKINFISVFAYAGPRYVFATEKSGFQSGFMVSYGGGVELNFSKKFGLTAFYENSANTSYYNLSLGLKF